MLVLALLACAACDSGSEGPAQAEGSSTSGSGSTGSTGGMTGQPTSEAESSGSPTESSTGQVPGTCKMSFAEVSWFQVVETPAWLDAALVEPAAREIPLVEGRGAVLRAYVSGDTDGPADVTVHVDIAVGGQTERYTSVTSVAGPDDAVVVDVPASAMQQGATYVLSIADCDDARIPLTGEADLGVVTTGPLRVHLVPFEVGGFTPDTSEAVLDGYREALVAMYPVTDVEFTVLPVEPDDSDGQLDMGGLMSRLIALQEDLVFASGDVDPSVADIYYYGMVTGAATRDEFCDSCPTGTSESGNGDRAGSAIGAAFADELAESTLVHEFGHMHGLLHSPCGDPSLQDPEFPYADGSTATEGWDQRTASFVPASHNDVMGYCQPRWVSDYHYAKMVQWVQLAQSWASGGRAAIPSRREACSTHRAP